jgi:hypothetical protein
MTKASESTEVNRMRTPQRKANTPLSWQWWNWIGYWLAVTVGCWLMLVGARAVGLLRETATLVHDLETGSRNGTLVTVMIVGAQWWRRAPTGSSMVRKWVRVFVLGLNAHLVVAFVAWEVRGLLGVPITITLLERLILSAMGAAFAATGAGFVGSKANAPAHPEGKS